MTLKRFISYILSHLFRIVNTADGFFFKILHEHSFDFYSICTKKIVFIAFLQCYLLVLHNFNIFPLFQSITPLIKYRYFFLKPALQNSPAPSPRGGGFRGGAAHLTGAVPSASLRSASPHPVGSRRRRQRLSPFETDPLKSLALP